MKPIWLIAIGAGGVSAVLFLAMILGSMLALPLAYVAPLPLFLVGLSLGAGAGAVASAVSSLVVAIALGGSAVTGLVYFLVNGVPATLLSRQALLGRLDEDGRIEWYPSGLLLGWLAGLGLVAVGVIILWLAEHSGGLDVLMAGFSEPDLRRILPADQLAKMRGFLNKIGTVVPAIVAVSWMVMVAANAALAQGLLKMFGRNRRDRIDIISLELPEWIPIVAAIVALGAYFLSGIPGFLAKNAMVVLILPFVVVGLAVVHAFARHIGAGTIMLVIVYFLLVLFSPLAFTIALLGALDQILGLRRRLAAQPPA